MKPLMRNDKATLTATDWERAALELIAERGVQALAIEPLARRMGITKGSFYWHFASREALLALSKGENFRSITLRRGRARARWSPREPRLDDGIEGLRGRLAAVVDLLTALGCAPGTRSVY